MRNTSVPAITSESEFKAWLSNPEADDAKCIVYQKGERQSVFFKQVKQRKSVFYHYDTNGRAMAGDLVELVKESGAVVKDISQSKLDPITLSFAVTGNVSVENAIQKIKEQVARDEQTEQRTVPNVTRRGLFQKLFKGVPVRAAGGDSPKKSFFKR